MKFHSEAWTLTDLEENFQKNNLNLAPPYQRNDIWSNPSKKRLIDSIKKEYPLPAFFFHDRGKGKYDVVDGQQRIRTIVGYMKNLFKDLDKKFYSEIDYSSFNNYKIFVTIIDQAASEPELSDFYFRVNKFGTKLNRPEIIKAQYLETGLQKLVSDIADSEEFQELLLFTPSNMNRMTDLDFIAELLGLLEYGILDKKKGADDLYESKFTTEKAEALFLSYSEVLEVIQEFNKIYPISKTRYKQRNDFYTLWGFIKDNIDFEKNTLIYFYKILVLIGNDITPSNEKSESMANYAFNCVSQSNSKKARLYRLQFLQELFLNTERSVNETQKDVLNFYDLLENDVKIIGRFLNLDGEKIQSQVGLPVLFGE